MSDSNSQTVFSEERKREILRLLSQKSKVTVQELVDRFKVSSATIRTDLRDLSEQKMLKRTHGGAINNAKLVSETPIDERSATRVDAKQKIAQAALQFIEEGDCIILDTSTTVVELANLLTRFSNLTVITNDLVIARIVERIPGMALIFLGGTVRNGFHCTVGPMTLAMLQHLTVDKLFVAADGFSLDRGVTTTDILQAESKRGMIKSAKHVYLLADSSKWNLAALARFADLKEIEAWIVESAKGLPVRQLNERGLRVVTAEETVN